MIQRVYEGASKSEKLSRVIVATDDQRIFDHVKEFGGEVMLTSASHTTGTDRCGEVMRNVKCDIVLNIQGDEPLVDPLQLDQLCSAFDDNSVEIATLCIGEVTEDDLHNKNRIKLVRDVNHDAIYFSRSSIPNSENAKMDSINTFPFLRHIGLYAYRSETLHELVSLEPTELERIESLEQLRWLFHGYKIRAVQTTIETPNIDVPEDVEKVLQFL